MPERRPRPAAERAKRESRDTRPAARPATPSGPRKLTFKEARELEAIEDTIAAAEARVQALEATLSDPSVFKDRPTEAHALIAELDAARADVERLFTRWQELDAVKQASPRS